ncbi:nose resistant to fluoxetine protein 6-like [Tropilaelaps mercedesae]|uniref:Nose resistant to fluoxetine protein 6-like n=1 Tax=Tropilaelaps mercedesae TaxID=418985 RepID=A0A1V9XZM1_9ACAR|nr:nose resistant to fluoxetine protein 6-like [Tropilaelaps mercedesae]
MRVDPTPANGSTPTSLNVYCEKQVRWSRLNGATMAVESGVRYGVTLLLMVVSATVVAQNEQNEQTEGPSQAERLIAFVDEILQPHIKSILRLVLEADVSSDCQVYLAKFGVAARRLEPWTSRLIDASGKPPSGLFQGTLSDLGAYDECLETVLHDKATGEETLRGQYCNVYVKSIGEENLVGELKDITALSHPRTPGFIDFQNSSEVPGMHIGLCMPTDCSREDLQKLSNKFGPLVLSQIKVADCVTGEARPLDNRQISAL